MLLRQLALPLLIVTVAFPALADDGAIQGVGGAIQLLDEHATVVMEKMDVVVDFGNAEADVDCTFVFHNTGPAMDVRMGFPESGFGVDVDPNNPHGFRSFTSWVDGVEVPTTIEGPEARDGRDWRRWRVKTVHFEPDQRRVVRVAYPANFGEVSTGERYFIYEVRTGASWKGPIGRARVHLNFHHDPSRGTYVGRSPYRLDPRFRPCGPRSYEWTAQQLEPDKNDDVTVHYVPRYVFIGSLRRGDVRWRPQEPGQYPYVEDGVVWLPVDIVAGYSGAEVSLNGAGASLLRGTRRVELSANSDAMITEAGPRRLPRATRVEHERLMVPAAPVLRALGATVIWEAEESTVIISFPEDAPLRARSEPEPLRDVFRKIPDGFAPPGLGSYASDIREHFQDPAAPPWLAIGDFFGDGADDVALFLQKGNQAGIGVVERPNGGPLSFRWLPGSPHEASTLLDGTFFTVLRTRAPGDVSYYLAREPTPESGRVIVDHDGLEVVAWGKASTLWYWDRQDRQYRQVVASD